MLESTGRGKVPGGKLERQGGIKHEGSGKVMLKISGLGEHVPTYFRSAYPGRNGRSDYEMRKNLRSSRRGAVVGESD